MKNDEIKLDWSKYDWRDFEKICFAYIKTIYSAQFYKTKLTKAQKDSGRDIVITERNGNFEAWGECKDHKRNIGLSVIGKNVVLALSHQINKAIFFSVTKITLNTKVEILKVAQKNGFEVLFLDDQVLNEVIINCKKVARKYFRKEYEKYINKNENNIWTDVFLSEYPFAEDAKNNEKKQYHLENGFQIYLHIFFKNMGNKDIHKISIKLVDISKSDMIFYTTEYVSNDIISIHSDLLYTFYGLIFSPQKNINLPQVIIEYTFSDGTKCQENIQAGIVDASDVWKAPYINSDSIRLLADVTNLLENTVPQNYVKVVFLYGKSGMGKSRLMFEIENKAYENAYRVIHIDFRESQEVFGMRKFIMSLLGIPFTKMRLQIAESDFEKVFQDRLEKNDITILYKFLFKEKEKTSFEQLTPTIINILVILCQDETTLIALDNIQELSHELQIMFWNILEHCKHISIPICFLFTQNTDRKIMDKHALIEYLCLTGEGAENYVFPHSCELLKEKDAILLMQELLHLKSESEIYLKAILKKIECCPMDILLLSKTLEITPGFLQTIGSNRYIISPKSLDKLNNLILGETDDIIKARLDNFTQDERLMSVYMQLFSLISFFEGKLPMSFFEACGFSQDILLKSNKNLITKTDLTENMICFYHEKIAVYMENIPIGIPTKTIKILNALFVNNNEKNIIEIYLYIKLLRLQGEKEKAIVLGIDTILEHKHSNQSQYMCKICDLLQSIIDPQMRPVEYFTVIFYKADLFLEKVNISEAEHLFEEAKKIMCSKNTLFAPKDVVHFFHRYINQKLHTLQYTEALKAIEEFENLGSESIQQNLIIQDRLCVAKYSLGEEQEALDAIDNVIKIAHNDNIWLSIAYSDKAFTYYYNSKNIQHICKNFIEAIKYHEKCVGDTGISREIEIAIQKTIVYILQNKISDAISSIQNSVQIAEKTNYGYLLIPSYNLNAFLMCLNYDLQTSKDLLEIAFSTANIFSNSKAFISIYNNLGSISIAEKEYEKAFEYYLAAINVLKSITIPENSFRYLGLLCNFSKLSLYLNKENSLNDIICDYKFEELDIYTQKCKKALREKTPFDSFGYGVLSLFGYDYLYY